jgi:hypothetical protein
MAANSVEFVGDEPGVAPVVDGDVALVAIVDVIVAVVV